MAKTGFVKFDRKIGEWGWYKDQCTFKVFFHLVTFANFTPAEFLGVTIHRGQIARSYRTIAEETGLTEMQVRTAIKHLKLTGEVTQATHPKFSLFTVLNYEKYQDVTGNLTGKQQATNKQLTGEQQQYKKNKNNKEEKEYTAHADEIDTLKNRCF
jgi:hypothetical protein